MGSQNTANFDFLLDQAVQRASVPNPRILDYGCGLGALVQHGLKKNLSIVGCDPYEGHYEDGLRVTESLRHYLKKMDNGKIPFPDQFFDVVISNQVFEHIPEHGPSFAEIRRVLKSGAPFIALFPLKDTFYEAHAFLYFPHYLQNHPRLQYQYLKTCKALGLTRCPDWAEEPPEVWATKMQNVLQSVCYYHKGKDVQAELEGQFGARMQDIGAEFLAFRGRKLKLDKIRNSVAKPLVDPLYKEIAKRRAGIALAINRPKAA